MTAQSTDTIMMVRPAAIGWNPETEPSNAFQAKLSSNEIKLAQDRAAQQFQESVDLLLAADIDVLVIPDKSEPPKPDAVFPNNWISTHDDGRIVLYPMLSPLRRAERRPAVVELLKERYGFSEVVDYTAHENDGKFLEGTGSLVLDRASRIAFACLSPRTHPDLVAQFGREMGYETVVFRAEAHGKPVYHTNVMLAITTDFAMVGMALIPDENDRMLVAEKLDVLERKTLLLSPDEVDRYAGNVLEVRSRSGDKRLVLSSTAWLGLSPRHKEVIADAIEPVILPIGAIQDLGGGSARCMIAEIFRPAPSSLSA